MTFPRTLTVIVLNLSPADSDASTGTARPINRSNLQCRPFLPRRLTHLRRIDLDHWSRAQQADFRSNAPTKTQRQAPTSLHHYPHSAPPPAASFNPASMRSHSRPMLRARSCHATSQNPQDSVPLSIWNAAAVGLSKARHFPASAKSSWASFGSLPYTPLAKSEF